MTHLDIADDFLNVLRSPQNGRELAYYGQGVLSDGETLWPCIDGIPYLRRGRESLRRAAVEALRAGAVYEALALLLSDRKDASIQPVPLEMARQVARGAASAREAMEGLRYGGLGWYLQHRGCQPSFLSGLALLEIHAPRGATLLDLACGSGQYLRAWQQANESVTAIGADMIYSHLWIARRYMAPSAWLVCFDANGPFPLADGVADIALAQDAFHYFVSKRHVVDQMRRVSQGGTLLLGHVHNAAQPNYSAGRPLDVDEYLGLIQPSTVYDDDALTRFALMGTAARPATMQEMRASAALAFSTGPVRKDSIRVTLPPDGTSLVLNPLLASGRPVWPSPRFEEEFVGSWQYLQTMVVPESSVLDRALSGALGADPAVDEYARRRVLLDLPGRWL
jgi:SAM-dependent methyltransferase